MHLLSNSTVTDFTGCPRTDHISVILQGSGDPTRWKNVFVFKSEGVPRQHSQTGCGDASLSNTPWERQSDPEGGGDQDDEHRKERWKSILTQRGADIIQTFSACSRDLV